MTAREPRAVDAATASATANAATAGSYEATLGALAHQDPRIVVLTAENRAAIRGLCTSLGPRFVDVGICEQTMVGMAAGLALRGRIPVVHALATFLTLRAFEFIRTDVGIAGLPVKLVGGVPGLLSEANGPTHQALDDLALMRAIPGMAIVCPADESELCAALSAVVASPGPVYIRHVGRRATMSHAPFVLGRAERLFEGRGSASASGDRREDVTILALGLLVEESVAAAALLNANQISTGVVNMRTLAPLDEEAVVQAARSARLLVTVEDHFLVGGLYQAICEILVRRGLSDVSVLPIGFDARFFAPGLLADVLAHEELTGAALADRIGFAWNQQRAGRLAIEPSGVVVPIRSVPRGPSLA